MKYTLLFLAFILVILKTFGQSCGNDSVVTQNTRYFNDGDVELSIRVDSFDLTNGMKYTSNRIGINTVPGAPTYSQSTFIRNLISYNANHDTIQFIALQGNGSGYDNKKKTDFTYIGNRPLTRIEYNGAGATWTLAKSETWTYNGNNLISTYVLSDGTGNILKKTFSYSGLQGASLTFQIWSASNWLNNEKYLFTYSGGMKDSLHLQRWDIGASAWIDSLSAKYDTAQGGASLIRLDTSGTADSQYSYIIDTMNNVIYEYIIHNFTTDWNSASYAYYNGHLMIIHSAVGSSQYNAHDYYNYNQNGFLISESFTSTSSQTFISSSTSYDSISHPVHHNYSSSSGVHDGNRDTYYNYSSANKISLSYFNISDYSGMQCQGDSLQTIPIISGGCGSYHFTWTPTIRLSSSTIADPKIFLHDTTTYLVTVTDTTGHSDTATFIAYAEFSKSISFDTTLCPGCPVVLTTQSGPNESYEWYRNDTLIPFTNDPTYTAISTGDYNVRITNGYCTFTTDPVHLTLSGFTRIRGRIFLDIDSTCTFTTGDRDLFMYGVSPYLIQLSRQNYTAYLTPDSNGFFDIPIDTGTFFLSIVNPTNFYAPACPDTGIVPVYIPSFGDTITGIDLILKPLFDCNRLRVLVHASRFRPCDPVTISVNYFNEGSLDESNPVVNVTLPPELVNITTTQPHTIFPNNVYSFSLPPLLIGEVGSFAIHATVDCQPVDLVDATLCIDAEIKPVDFCSLEPDSTWDGSHIRVTSSCQNGSSVCFTIFNDSVPGGGDMSASSVWRLYEDNILIQQGTFILNAGHDTTLCFISDGRTFRLEADQLAGFPDNNFPSASIERCGTLPIGGNYSLNKILQHPLNNRLPFYHTYCNVVRNAFDPNAKTVQPTSQFVSKNDRLNYRIDFQNTGTDTANKVIITDELSYALDISTVQLLSSSHPYQFRIDGSTFIWEFNPILLPDSNVDEFASHGYVEFSIKPKQSMPVGTTISNRARIYFDSNPPINTMFVHSRICETGSPSVALQPLSTFCPGHVYSVTANVQFGGTAPTYKWYLNNSLLISTNDTLTLSGLNSNDVIKLVLHSNYLCALPDTVSSTITVTYTKPVITYTTPQLISTPAVSYYWYYNGAPILNAMNQNFTPVSSGDYQVQATDFNGCAVMSDVYYFYNVGIEELNGTLSLYPNPADQYIFIKGIDQTVEIIITDLTGRIIRRGSDNSSEIRIYTGELLPGIYFIELRSEKMNKFLPVVIEHSGR